MTLLSALLGRYYRFDDADPHWPDRDRLLTRTPSLLQPDGSRSGALAPGLAGFSPNLPGAAATLLDGPAGLAFGAALGLALAERLLAARFGKSLVDHRVWLVADARELAAGTAQEAAGVAGGLGLGRLAVLAVLPVDRPDLRARFSACGWTVRTVQAGDVQAADGALSACLRSQKPTLVLQLGAPPVPDAAAFIQAEADGPDGGGDGVGGKRGAGARRAWLKRLRRHANREAFNHALTSHLPPGWAKYAHTEDTLAQGAGAQGAGAAGMGAAGPGTAGTGTAGTGAASTQAAVRAALVRLAAVLPDLAHLPLTEARGLPARVSGQAGAAIPGAAGLGAAGSGAASFGAAGSGAASFGGSGSGGSGSGGMAAGHLVSWDGLDLAAPAALLGMALHGAMLPVSWSGATAAEWALPSLRAACDRHLRWLHIVAAPDAAGFSPPASAGLSPPASAGFSPPASAGMPTIFAPNLHVFAPADIAEAEDCLVLALRRMAGPSLLVLSAGSAARLPVATHRLCARGAYLVHAPPLRDATLLAAGTDLALALRVHAALAARGVNAALVSMPCRALFDAQDNSYRDMVLGDVTRFAFAQDYLSAFAGLTGPGDLILGQGLVLAGLIGRAGGLPPAGLAGRAGGVPNGGQDATALAALILRHLHRRTPELEAS